MLREKPLAVEAAAQEEHDAYHDHPFPDVVRRIVTLTGWKERALREAAIGGFEGQRELVATLNRLERDGKAEELYRDFLKQHPELAAKINLTAGGGDRGRQSSQSPSTSAEVAQVKTDVALKQEPAAGRPPGYVPLHTLLGDVQGSYPRAHKVIREVGIETWKPTPNARRLFVNVEQWIKAVRTKQPSEEQVETYIAGIEERKAAIRKKAIRCVRELPEK